MVVDKRPILVLGAGINGAAVARELALTNLKQFVLYPLGFRLRLRTCRLRLYMVDAGRVVVSAQCSHHRSVRRERY